MAKNNRLLDSINAMAKAKQMENIEKASNEMVPQIYAAMAIALHRTCGFGHERINRVFADSQRIWESFAGKGDEMIDLCEEETGIVVKSGDLG